MRKLVSRIGIMGLVLGQVACGAPASSSTSTATNVPTAAAEETPAASPSAAASNDESLDEATRPIFQNIALATVRVNGLNVRADRGTTAPLLTDPSDPTAIVRLNAGDHVLVISDTQAADGMWWLEIGTDLATLSGQVIVGWVAAGTRADPWVEEDNAWCPGAGPSLTTLISLSGVESIGCYSSTPLTFPAYRTTVTPDAGLGGACIPPPTFPAWLVCDNINYNWVNRDGGYHAEFRLHFDPATGIAPTGLASGESVNPQLQITGHFNDPAAVDCAPNPWTSAEEAASWLGCARLFVVEHID